MEIENANSHPFKVAITKDGDKMYANSHPYKVEVVEGGSSTELATELPEIGEEGTTYVLVDDVENPTKVYGTYIYQNGWILVSQPIDQAVQKVTELPETGEEGVLYYLEKEGEEDTYDLYRWINDEWIKVDTDIKLYDSTGTNTDGAMTQNAVTRMIYTQPDNLSRSGIAIGPKGSAVNGGISIRPGTQQGQTANSGEILIGVVGGTGGGSSQANIVIGDGGRVHGSGFANFGNTILGDSATIGDASTRAIEGAVAIGKNAHASQPGEMNIGSSTTRWGYNNSNYRLLTGLYDPQSDHDAATKGYVDTQAPAALTDAQYNALWSNPNPLTRLLTTISTGAGV